MGTGLVLLVFLALGAGIALPLGAALAVLARRGDVMGRKRRALFASLGPALILVTAGVSFAVYATWCERIRGTDTGIGDTWRVPLGGGYSLLMIDSPEQACIDGLGDPSSQFGLESLAQTGSLIVARDSAGRFLLLDTTRHTEVVLRSRDSAFAALRERGLHMPELHSPITYYSRRRWQAADVVAALFAASLPFCVAALLLFGWFRLGHHQPAGISHA
jgi:hypothetical protein